MRKFQLFALFILISTYSKSQFYFDPFNFELNDSTLSIRPDTSLLNGPSAALFDNTYIWFGIFPKTSIAVKMVVEHDLILLNNESAIDENNKIYINVTRDSLMDFKVRVIENGKVVKEHGLKDLLVTKEEEGRYKILAVEGLKKGQMIERLIVKLQNYNESGSMLVQQKYITQKHLISISAPANVKFAIKCYPDLKTFSDTVITDSA
jgi:hypothetical protein